MKHLDLFSGIGGFALAARWMGWETVGFCEIEPYPQAVLRKHWPDVPIFDDVRTLDATQLAGLGRIDLITGGFPCQDVSTAGKRAGLAGARSGLWSEAFRIVAETRPTWCVFENVPGLRTLGADRVLSDLAEEGYSAWPLVVGAVHTGAPHRRQRVWIVANADDYIRRADRRSVGGREAKGRAETCGQEICKGVGRSWNDGFTASSADAANAECPQRRSRAAQPAGRQQAAAFTGDGGCYQPDWRGWTDAPQPAVCRLDDGLPAWVAGCRVPALKALGNAIVPQVAYQLFRAIEAAALDNACFVRPPDSDSAAPGSGRLDPIGFTSSLDAELLITD